MTVADLQARWNRGDRGALHPVGPVKRVRPTDASSEYIAESPYVLAADAGAPPETYSLARGISSEGYSGRKARGYAAAQVAMAHAMRNEARRRGVSISMLLTRHTSGDERNGHYGRQSGRFASTRRPPRGWHVDVARAVLQGELGDISRGATKFFSPRIQDTGLQAGRSIRPADAVLRDWHRDGNAYVGGVAKIDSYELMFLAREPDAKRREERLNLALAIVRQGRGGGPGLSLAFAGLFAAFAAALRRFV